MVRVLTAAVLLTASLALQACLAATVAGAAVGVAGAGAVVKTTVGIGKSVIPYSEEENRREPPNRP